MHPTMTLIWQAMRQSGRVLLRQTDVLTDTNLVDDKRDRLVAGAAQSVFQAIEQHLENALPKHAVILAGEKIPTDKKDVWVVEGIDPLSHYGRAFPHYAIAMTWYHEGELKGAALYDPNLDEFFSAVSGQGAELNQHRIRVAKKGPKLSHSHIVSRFPQSRDLIEKHNAGYQRLASCVGSASQSQCASLSIAYVACGRYDAYWHIANPGVIPTAALLIAKEAGATISDWKGKACLDAVSELIVSVPSCYPDLQKNLLPSIKKF